MVYPRQLSYTHPYESYIRQKLVKLLGTQTLVASEKVGGKLKTIMLNLSLFLILQLSAVIINIPNDQPTIQAGIDVAVDTDTVLVQPGGYSENINFNGKNITVGSLFLTTNDTTFITQTIINGSQTGSVVKFENSENSSAVLSGFKITNGSNGGIYCMYSNPTIYNMIITSNFDPYSSGGGIYCYYSHPSIMNVTISNNSSQFGGGLYCQYASPKLVNVLIKDNITIEGSGGGIYSDQSQLSLINVTITGNYAVNGGGGFCMFNSNPSLKNVTIADNSTDQGSGFSCNWSNPNLVNCILWNNIPQEISVSFGSVNATYSNIQNGWIGEGNINEEPLFEGNGFHPYQLTENSPCIDVGTPDTLGLNLPEMDLIGNMRIWDGDGNGSEIIDMGAYEYDAPLLVDINHNAIIQTPSIYLSNYPNPFNPSTTIEFSIQNNSKVELSIYNMKGQKIKILANNEFEKGLYSIFWNGDDRSGKFVSSGIYYYKLKVNGKTKAVKKCLLLK